MLGIKYLDIGSGQNMEELGWYASDRQNDDSVIDENYRFDLIDGSLEFIYSSHFFEHIDDETAANLLREARRLLKPGAIFRIVVPNQAWFIEKYFQKDLEYLKNKIGSFNLSTWSRYQVDINLEQCLVANICAIDNQNLKLTPFAHMEDLSGTVPVVTYPHHDKLEGYYCGPPPEISTEEIKERVRSSDPKEFVDWVFKRSKESKITKGVFPSWHKNDWDQVKLEFFATAAGFKSVEPSSHAQTRYDILKIKNRECISKKEFSFYFDLRAP